MNESHHFDVPHYGRVSFFLNFEPELIKGRIEFPGVINSRRQHRIVSRWIKSITAVLDPDPRPFVLASVIAGKLAALGHESGGQVFGTYFPQ